jgi:YidC/Oxa1 family membrane protein insertase
MKPPKLPELSTELRLLIAFLLMGVVMFLTPYFLPSSRPQQKSTATKTAPAAAPVKPAVSSAPAAAAASPSTPTAAGGEKIVAEKEEEFAVETPLYRVVFSNRGATVRSWTLKEYRDQTGKPLELVNLAAQKIERPFSLLFKNQKPSVDLNAALWAARPLAGGAGIEYEFSDGRVRARKTFRFRRDAYVSQTATEVSEDGRGVPHSITWRAGFGDLSVDGEAAMQHTLYFDRASGKLVTHYVGDAKEGPIATTGPYSFAGIADTYFAAAFLPDSPQQPVEVTTFADPSATPALAEPQPHTGVAVGGEALNRYSLFVGPKDIDVLRAVNPQLERMVDFGSWFGFLAKPLFLALHWLNDNWVRNYGWAIVLLTVIINVVLFPLKITSMKSMKKMQALQPQILAINDKYKDVGMRDPRKQQQNAEVMDLYKKNGVNPAGGCVPMLLQIPFFIALYTVLQVSIDLRGASWLWVSDLSRPETIPIRILPVIMIASQFFMQKMTPAAGMDPAQQRIMLLMPLVLGFMFYGSPSGLVLYWLTSNLVGIAQQLILNRTTTAGVTAPPPVRNTKQRSGSRK